ncbi:polysaccharide deacetylase family protein [Paenibacillus beijingensis]|uniref:NodB homology domain-containing protein n=1 Tax=Paenibacillus beijingensis TaxID=1126833 RepID=A0A0D5NN97_9BACL|nr:polysaccharide deacetylase family protein [Paenibacillus beijingensis]AJY76615.1 hypothetical protein VN24_21115 [Paenibacillus beijingensis]
MNVRRTIVMAACMLLVLACARWNENMSAYLTAVKEGTRTAYPALARVTAAADADSELYAVIKQEATKRYVAPVDAKVDRVWHAVPGYNGLEIDIEQTYKAALAAGKTSSSAITYVFREIPPKVSLDDLGEQPIYRGNPNKPMVSLMINVAWGNEYLDSMLNTLDREGVKATFFLDGSWLKKNPELAKTIQSRGHEMSNHAYSHPDMKTLDRQSQWNQIAKTEALLKSTLGVSNRFFAPPSGSYNATTVKVAAEQGLKTVLWTLDTVDWRKPSPSWILNRIGNGIEPGSLILMHPTASARDSLAGIIKLARSKGYALGTVSQTLSPERVKVSG